MEDYITEEIQLAINDLVSTGEILVVCPNCDSYLNNKEYNDLFCLSCNSHFQLEHVKCYPGSTECN